MRRFGLLASGAVLGGSLYLLLIDTVSTPELYAGCGVVLLAALAFAASRERAYPQAIRPRWLLRSWRVLASVPRHVALVCADALAQPFTRRESRGEFRAVPFQGGDAALDHGRRALAESLGSFAPNTIVIGVDTERQVLLVHQLHRQGDRSELDVLGLG